jgi:DNA-dependent RNA polymerase auxiliary subunit epsilon
MKTYLIEYIYPRTQVRNTTYIDAEDKTEARDLFFENYPEVEQVEKITWVPTIEE